MSNIEFLGEFLPNATAESKGGIILGHGLTGDHRGKVSVTGSASVNAISSEIKTASILDGNKGTTTAESGVLVNSIPVVDGDLVTILRYDASNGVFVTNGWKDSLVVGYTSLETITANEDKLDHQVVLLNSEGNTSFPGVVSATAFNGLSISTAYADLAERYESDAEYPAGTLIRFGGEKEITVATEITDVHGVISENPAIILNKEQSGQPVVLTGKTRVRVIGEVKKGQKLYLNKDVNGVAVADYNGMALEKGNVIAIALEDNLSPDEKLVMCVTKLSF